MNDILGGLGGITSTPAISLSQLEDDCVDCRLQIIKEYSIKNLLPRKDLMDSINCIQVDCLSLDKCCISTRIHSKPIAHFELPQLLNDFGDEAIEFIGSTDKMVHFKAYTSKMFKYHKDKFRGSNRPYVYIETTPNINNMYDAWIFNAPLLKQLTVIGIFKDPRQVEEYACCSEDSDNMTFINMEVKKRLTELKIRYYRQMLAQPTPNNQIPK